MQVYDKIIDWYCASRSPDAGVEVIRSFAQKLQPAATVLDIGCGFGSPITATVLELGFKPYGIDSSIKMVERFKQNLPNTPVQHSDVLSSDFFNVSFDAVVGYGFIFHLRREQQKKVIAKVANHIKPNGYFLFNSGDIDDEVIAPPECNGGEVFMSYSMTRLNYEKVLKQNKLVLISHYVEKKFGSTIYIAKKVSS